MLEKLVVVCLLICMEVNNLRYYKYMDAVASNSTYLDPQKLSPTERVAYFHSLRVHLQIIVWKRQSNEHDDLNPQQGVGSLMEVHYYQL